MTLWTVSNGSTFQAPTPADADLITNGDFASDITGWDDKSSGTASVTWDAGGKLSLNGVSWASNVARAEQAITTVPGSTYTIQYYKDASSALIRFKASTTTLTGNAAADLATVNSGTGAGTETASFTATTTTTYIAFESYTNTSAVTVDNVVKRTVAGDFFTTTNTANATLGTVNGLTVPKTSRVVATVTDPDEDDGADWEVQGTRLDVAAPSGAWRTVGEQWENDYFAQLAAAVPDPPLVIVLHNNEATYTAISDMGYRFDAQYPSLTTSYSASPPNKKEAQVLLRISKARVQREMIAAMREALPSNWRSKLRFMAYNSSGGDGARGMRPVSGALDESGWDGLGVGNYVEPNITKDAHAEYTGYGLEWSVQDGGSTDKYFANEGLHEIQAQWFTEHEFARVLEYARARNPAWISGVSHFTTETTIQDMLTNGTNAYLSPTMIKAVWALDWMLLRPCLMSYFHNNATDMTTEVLTAGQRSTYSIAETHTLQDYQDAYIEFVTNQHSNATLINALQWELQYLTSDDDVWEADPEGPYADASIPFVENSVQNVNTATSTDAPVITVVRRDGHGNGLIFAWANQAEQASLVVETLDGQKTITGRVNGSWWLYDPDGVTEITIT